MFEGDYAYASIDNETKFVAHTNGKLYEVILHVDLDVFAGISDKRSLHQNLWHYRLGHLNVCDMKKLVSRQMVDGLNKGMNIESIFCEACILGKQTRTVFPSNKNPRSHHVLELIHTDVCGLMPTAAYDGTKYFVTFTDDFSRASMVYCIQKKSKVLDKFKDFEG